MKSYGPLPGASLVRHGVRAALLLAGALALAPLGGCRGGGAQAALDEEALMRARLERRAAEARERREAKEGVFDPYNRKYSATEVRTLEPLEDELRSSQPDEVLFPGVYSYSADNDPYEHVRGQTRTGTKTTQTIQRLPDGSMEITTEQRAIYRDRVTPKVTYEYP